MSIVKSWKSSFVLFANTTTVVKHFTLEYQNTLAFFVFYARGMRELILAL
jgi:hypothetical protein